MQCVSESSPGIPADTADHACTAGVSGSRRDPSSARLSALSAFVDEPRFVVLSTDLFDTVLLRDHTTESGRFAQAARRAAVELQVSPDVLARLRWSMHDAAYRSVAMERPNGEATLASMCRAMATALGLDAGAAEVLRRTEVDVDSAHLRPNRPLLALFDRAASRGMRIVAVSDTYYGQDDLTDILGRVVGAHPFSRVYSSAELGLTKHSGTIFGEVTGREGVDPRQVVHVGDSATADVERARAAGWTAVHLPRGRRHLVRRAAGGVLAVPVLLQRSR